MRHGKRKMAFGLFIVVMICVLSACGSSGESEKNNTKMHSEVSGSVSDSATETEVPERKEEITRRKMMLQKARNRMKLRLQREIPYLLQRLLTIPLRMR